MAKKNRREVKRKEVDGVEYLQCICGKWVAKEDAVGTFCKDCHRERYLAYQKEYREKNKALNKKRKSQPKATSRRSIANGSNKLDLELQGSLPVSKMFEEVPEDVKAALLSGDFKAFMKATETRSIQNA